MEKLLKLLNEYVGEEYLYAEFELQDGMRDNFFHNKEGEHTIEESYVISKKFGFIEWLVDNNKVNIHFVDALIIRLALGDNPIQDLISLLK